jgi:hypothetical protein
MEAGLEVNTEETMFSCLIHHQSAGQSQYTESFENVTNFKHWGIAMINQNYIHEDI